MISTTIPAQTIKRRGISALNKSLETARNTQDEEWDYNLHLKFDKDAR